MFVKSEILLDNCSILWYNIRMKTCILLLALLLQGGKKMDGMVLPSVTSTPTVKVHKEFSCPDGYQFARLELPYREGYSHASYDQPPETVTVCVTEEFLKDAQKLQTEIDKAKWNDN